MPAANIQNFTALEKISSEINIVLIYPRKQKLGILMKSMWLRHF